MLIAARESFAASTRRRLPYDSRVEYLESTGTQYIDTDCNADGDLFWSIRAKATQTTLQRMGAIQLSPTLLRNHLSVPEGGGKVTTIGYAGSASALNGEMSGILEISMRYSGGAVVLAVDGAQYGSVSKETFDTGAKFYLFARNDKTAVSYGSMRIYSARFFQGNTQIRDYIPVRVNGKGYMYDKVSGRLVGNAGTGSFTIGPDKTA